jgi:hypothetical protein
MYANLATRIDEEGVDPWTLVIPQRFCGPPGSGNGGYVAGRLAACTGAARPVEVTLRRPAPLATRLTVWGSAGPVWTLTAGADAIAEARLAGPGLDLAPPVRPGPAAIGEAAPRADHPFPGCFVCGPARRPGDGLGLAPAPVPGAGGVVAARWTPPADLADARGRVETAIVWAALDCPGYFAILSAAPLRKLLLGRMTATLAAPVRAGEPYAVIGWPLGGSGRRYQAATALLGADGRVRALSRQVWIAPREG